MMGLRPIAGDTSGQNPPFPTEVNPLPEQKTVEKPEMKVKPVGNPKLSAWDRELVDTAMQHINDALFHIQSFPARLYLNDALRALNHVLEGD